MFLHFVNLIVVLLSLRFGRRDFVDKLIFGLLGKRFQTLALKRICHGGLDSDNESGQYKINTSHPEVLFCTSWLARKFLVCKIMCRMALSVLDTG
jgi:hypothetical protein